MLPWAILPEVDFLVARHPGEAVATAFMTDVAHGAFTIEWGDDTGTRRALEIRERYRSLDLE